MLGIARYHDGDGNMFRMRAAEDRSSAYIEKYSPEGRTIVVEGAHDQVLAKFLEDGDAFFSADQYERLGVWQGGGQPLGKAEPVVFEPVEDEDEIVDEA